MVINHVDPLSAISSSINATIKILEITYQLKAVDEQTADLLSTTRHVDSMVQEAHRLRRLKAGLLNTSERTWIDTVINDTEDALRAVAKLVEPCRVDKATKHGIRFGHRVMWVFRDNPSVRDKHQKLQVCHQSLTVVFTCLYSKDAVVIAPAPEERIEEQPPPYDPQLKELLDWQNRRKVRKSVGEREGHTDGNTGLKNGSSNDVPVAGPSSPCLLAVPLDEDGEAANISTLCSEMSFELPTMPTPEAQPSAPRNDILQSSATASPESNNRSPPISEHDSSSYDDIRDTTSATNACKDYISPTPSLPEIDSLPLATMIGPYNFNGKKKEGSQVSEERLTHEFFSTWDQPPSSSAVAPNILPTNTLSSPTLPLSAVAMPTSPWLGPALGWKWLEPARYNSFDRQNPIEAPSLGQHPHPARFNSDMQLRTTYQSDRLDALARAEDVMTRGSRAVSIGHGGVKRGGRSWLAFHATRSDMGHGIDQDG